MSIQWPLVLFSTLAGCGGALMIFACIAEYAAVGYKSRCRSTIISLILLVCGGVFSIMHLAQPANVMAAAANLGSFSAISMELIFLALTFVLVLVYAILLKKGDASTSHKGIALCCAISGALLALVTGSGYVIPAMPAWNTPLLPLAYLGSACAMGAFLFVLLLASEVADANIVKRFSQYTLIIAIISACLMVGYAFSIGAAPYQDHTGLTLGFVLSGAAAPLFWLGIVACGSVLTIVAAAKMRRADDDTDGKGSKSLTTMAIAGFTGSAVGAICLRCLMWMVGIGLYESLSRVVIGH